MSSSCDSLTDTVPQCKTSCDSHVSVYYEQNQKEEEATKPNCCKANAYCCEEIVPRCPLVEIHEEETTCIDLPPLIWHGYNCCPRVLTITNTGRTISINGNWTNNRPYIEGGPLNGTYLLSQIHFHCPSEHVIDGRRYPLEMHIVHYKTSYLTQERAMQEKDGTVVLVYLFQCVQMGATIMSHITRLAPELTEANRPMESCNIPLGELIKPFMSNYYVYWGSIATKNNCYLLQWIVNCNLLKVTKQEAEDLSNIITCAVGVKVQRTPRVIPDYDAIYRVGEADYSLPPLKVASCNDVCIICKSGQSELLLACDCQSKTSLKSSCGKRSDSKCSKCRIFNITRDTCGSRKCSKCKIVNITRDTCCEARRGLVIVKKIPVKKSKKKKMKKCCAQKSKDKSESESLLSCVCDVNQKKIKKFKKKKLFGKLKKLCDSESEKSSSKSSVCSDKLKVKVDIVPQNCDSEVEESSKKKNTKCVETEIAEKGKRRKKEVTVVQSAYSVKEGASKSSLKASADLSFLGMNVSGLNLFNPNSSADDNDKTEEGNKKESLQNLEFKTDGEIAEKCSKSVLTKESGSNLDEGKKEIISSKDDNSKSPMVTRLLKSRPKSPKNVQKPNDPENSEGKANNRATSRSKSKSPVIDALKRKMSLKKDRERSSSNSKSKMFKSDSKSKMPRNKKVAESAKSAQEVKCTATKTKVQIDNLKCDTSLSGNMKTKSNKGSSKIIRSKSKEAAKGKNKADGKGTKGKHDDEITTIFEKKKKGKKVQSVTGDGNDVNVNFLLTPGNAGIPSNGQTTSESDFAEEKKVCEDINENWGPFDETFTVNTAAILESEFPRNQPKDNSQGCFLMEHLFRTEYKDKACEGSSQEYHLAIIYDQCILQEYRGKFHPQELQLGDCKMLTLIPKYPEPKITNFQLQDCSVKKESSDKICIRVKFILKDLNVLHIFANTGGRPNGTPEKKETLLYDQQIQCNLKELNFAENCDLKFIEESKNYKKIENFETNENFLNELTSDNREKHSNQLQNKEKQMKQSKDGENQKLLSDSKETLKSRSKSEENQKMQSESKEKQKLGSKSKERQNVQSESEEKQKLGSKSKERQNLRSKSQENQKLRSEIEEKQKTRSESKERQNVQSESEQKQKLGSKSKERQNLRSESKEDKKLRSEIEEKQRTRSESKERQNVQSESEQKQKLGSKSKERQNLRSESKEDKKLRSEIEEKQRTRSESKERQNVQSETEQKQKLGSKSKERQNLRSESKEDKKLRSEIEEKQRTRSESKERQNLRSESKEDKKLRSEIEEKQRTRSESKERQNVQSEIEEKLELGSKSKERQNFRSKSQENQKSRSEIEEKQKTRSESKERQNVQSESEEKQKLGSKSKERQNFRSKSQENQKSRSEIEEKQKTRSESKERQNVQSEIEEKLELGSKSKERQNVQSESEEKQKLGSKSKERQNLRSKSKENQKSRSDSVEKQNLSSETEGNQKLESNTKDKLRSKSKENQKVRSERKENQKMPPESEEKQKLQSKRKENQNLQSQSEENRKIQSENEEKQNFQSESDDYEKMQLKRKENLPLESEVNQDMQSESTEKQKSKSKRKDKQNLRSKSKENQRMQSENVEKQNLSSETEGNQKLESNTKDKLRSKSKENQKVRLEREENQKMPPESEEKQKLQSKRKENQNLQSQSEENRKIQSENEEKQNFQSESDDYEKMQLKRKENLPLESEANQKMPSESQVIQGLPSESEKNQKLQLEIEEKHELQSKKKEKQKLQLENEKMIKIQSESEENQKMPPMGEENKKLQSGIEEKQKLQSNKKDNKKLRSKSKENQILRFDCEEKQNLQSESDEKRKLESESEDKEKPQENKSIFWEKGMSEPQKSGVIPERDTEVCSQDASQSCFIEQISLDSNRKKSKVETLCSEQSEKKLKALFVKRRKTVYFIYDKVEKDENTGKEIFVGSFKTKEEVESLKKQKALPQENQVAGKKSGKTSEVKRKIENLEGSSKKKSSSPDKNSLSISEGASHKKIDVITLLKYIPKRFKKGSKNVLIEKTADNSQENGKSSTKLGKIRSGHKKRSSKAFIYEPKEPSESESQENAISDGGKSEKKSEAVNADVINGRDDHSQSEVNVSEKSSNAEEDSVRDNSE